MVLDEKLTMSMFLFIDETRRRKMGSSNTLARRMARIIPTKDFGSGGAAFGSGYVENLKLDTNGETRGGDKLPTTAINGVVI